MFSFKRKNATQTNDEFIEVVQMETVEDKLDRALREACADDTAFAVRMTQAVKIIQGDRIMLAHHRQSSNQADCTYAEAMQALLALVRRNGDYDVPVLKQSLAQTVAKVLAEGRRFKTVDDVEGALATYRSAQR